MADILRVNGSAQATEEVGRDLVFVTVEGANAVLNDLQDADGSLIEMDHLVELFEQFCTLTIIGDFTTGDDVTFVCEGLGVGDALTGPFADPLAITDAEIEAEIDALILVNVPLLGAVDVTIVRLEGATLAV